MRDRPVCGAPFAMFFFHARPPACSFYTVLFMLLFSRCFSSYSLQVNIFPPVLSTLGSLSFFLHAALFRVFFSCSSHRAASVTLLITMLSSLHFFSCYSLHTPFNFTLPLTRCFCSHCFFFKVLSSRSSLSAVLLTLLFHAALFTYSFRSALITLIS